MLYKVIPSAAYGAPVCADGAGCWARCLFGGERRQPSTCRLRMPMGTVAAVMWLQAGVQLRVLRGQSGHVEWLLSELVYS